MYIDYTYFMNNGGSMAITGAEFPAIEFRARKIIDRMTQQRIQAMAAVPEAVKRLMVELVNLESAGGSQAALNAPVTSFSNDGYSETYAAPLTSAAIAEMGYKLILEYLSGEADDKGTPLLYLGVD